MPEHPTRGPSRRGRGIAAALIVPAAAVAAIFGASSVANGTTAAPAAQQTSLPPELSPGVGSGTATGGGTTGTHTGTGTATRTPTRTATPSGTGTAVVPGVPTGSATALTCVSGTATPSRTGTGVVPGVPTPSGTRTPTHTTSPTRTPTHTGTGPSVGNVPGAVATTPSGTHTSTEPGAAVTTIKLGTAGGKSNVLVDQNGCALYLNTSDTTERTNVETSQEATFIPVPAPAQVSGPGLEQSEVGTFVRPDGKRQATFDGHQLYRFAGDRAPGEAKGQGVDNEFFLVNQNGEAVR